MSKNDNDNNNAFFVVITQIHSFLNRFIRFLNRLIQSLNVLTRFLNKIIQLLNQSARVLLRITLVKAHLRHTHLRPGLPYYTM